VIDRLVVTIRNSLVWGGDRHWREVGQWTPIFCHRPQALWMAQPADLLLVDCAQHTGSRGMRLMIPGCRADSHRSIRGAVRAVESCASSPQASGFTVHCKWRPLSKALIALQRMASKGQNRGRRDQCRKPERLMRLVGRFTEQLLRARGSTGVT